MVKGISGGGEGVVAELGQDVMGLPEDLAGLGQRGALAVAAVLDLGVVGVVGSRGPGVPDSSPRPSTLWRFTLKAW